MALIPWEKGAEYLTRKVSGFRAPDIEFLPAAKKTRDETIVFVPFFGGKKAQLRRHVDFVNKLGFDAVLFQLTYHDKTVLSGLPLGHQFRFGLKHQWALEIENVLDRVEGPKVVFAFSNPSSSAIEAILRRYKNGKRDIRAMICDSGPFANLWSSNWRYLSQEMKMKSYVTRTGFNLLIQLLWCPRHDKSLREDLARFPKSIPILSIRGWNDTLVPVSSINKAFEGHRNLNLEELALPDAGHLNGLKDCPEEYKPRVERFLSRNLK